MFNFLNKKKNKDFDSVVNQELKRNKKVLRSLREYDEGKKDISTAHIKKYLPNIRTTSR